MEWDCNHFVGNVGIQNIFRGARYQDTILSTTLNKRKYIKAIILDKLFVT